MPVPLPTPETVNLVPPDAAETQRGAEGLASVVAGREGLLPIQRSLIEALFAAMTGHTVSLSDHPSLTPAEVARALARRDLQFRSRMVQVALLGALVRHPLPEDIAESVEELAQELGVQEGMVKVARDFAAGSLELACFDFERAGYTGNWVADEAAASAATHASHVLDAPWDVAVTDAALAARWAALQALPGDTIGRKVWEMYQSRGFTFPGLPGSAPPLLAQHDWVHVLADFGTTVECEVEVFGFIARANDDLHAFSLLAMVISLFETGYLATGAGLFQASPGHFSGNPGMAVRLSDAMRRGALCHDRVTGSDSIDYLKLDWFAVADRTCEDLRARFGVVPKSAAAREAGSVGLWEPGGISPFQLNAGRQLAEAHGVAYDAHGASV
jgi:hypothetical protein